ncbi:hypothetical protein ACWDYH_00420 [Nocardia goodfellowii]
MKHYSEAEILEAAHGIGENWKKTVISLGTKETAYRPDSTKWDYLGPGEITYRVHPSGWSVEVADTITRATKRSA